MNTIFNKTTRDELIHRINTLNQNSTAQWGKMNIFQMVKRNTYWNGWILGKDNHTYKQTFIGKIFGKTALKKMIKDEKPLNKNIPTSAQFKVSELIGDLEVEKSKWIFFTISLKKLYKKK